MIDEKVADSSVAPGGQRPQGARRVQDAVIRFAGNSQDGIQAIGGFLARLAGRTDKEVITYMTIPATISGGPSIYQVRLGTGEVLSAGDDVDILVAFYQHSYVDHVSTLRDGGILIYDSDNVQPDLNEKRYRLVGVPITGQTVEAIGGTAKDKGKNMFVLGLIARMFDLDVPKLEAMLQAYYKGKGEDVIRNVIGAFNAGYGYDIGKLADTFEFVAPSTRVSRKQVVMDGNQAIAYGAIAAGIRFGARLSDYTVVQHHGNPPSRAAKIRRHFYAGGRRTRSHCDGLRCFPYSGYLSLTGTSGPGLSLKTEALGWAVMAEMPIVIIDVQRGGPSTGLPTSVEQSDLNIACFGGHGDSPRIVLAPYSVEDCFYTTLEAAKLAREYSSPVIILSDQALATRFEAWEMPDLAKITQDISPDFTPRGPNYKPYENAADGIAHHAPPGTPMVDGKYPVVTGLEHDEAGHPASRPANHVMMVAKRRRKLQVLASRLPKAETYGPPEGDVLLVGWGSSQGPIREAVDKARAAGESVSSLNIRYIQPLQPGIGEIFEGFNHVFVAEINDEGLYGYGQLASLLRARYCTDKIRGINKTDGLPFKVREILNGMSDKLKHSSEPALVSA